MTETLPKEVILKAEETEIKTTLCETSKGYSLLALPASHIVRAPDGHALWFANEQDARAYYERECKMPGGKQ